MNFIPNNVFDNYVLVEITEDYTYVFENPNDNTDEFELSIFTLIIKLINLNENNFVTNFQKIRSKNNWYYQIDFLNTLKKSIRIIIAPDEYCFDRTKDLESAISINELLINLENNIYQNEIVYLN